MEEKNIQAQGKELKVIDLSAIFKKMIANRKLYYKTLPVAFILSCIYILSRLCVLIFSCFNCGLYHSFTRNN